MPIIISPPPLLLLLHRLSCFFFLLLLCLPPSTPLDRSTWIEVQRMHRPTASFLLQVVNRHNVTVRPDVTLDRANEHCEFVLSQNYGWDLQQDRQLWLRLSWGGDGKNESVFINPIHTDTAQAAQGKTYVFGILSNRATLQVFQRGEEAARTEICNDGVVQLWHPPIPLEDIYTFVVVERKGKRKVTAAILNNDTHLEGEKITLNEEKPSHKFVLSKDAQDLKRRQKVWLHLTEGEGEYMQEVSINPIHTDNEITAEGRTYIFGVSRNRISLAVLQRRRGAGIEVIETVFSVNAWGRFFPFPAEQIFTSHCYSSCILSASSPYRRSSAAVDESTFVSVKMNTAPPLKVGLLNADNATTAIDTLHGWPALRQATFCLSKDAEDLRQNQPVWLLVTRAKDPYARPMKIDPIGGDNATTAEGKTYFFEVYEHRVALAVFKHKKEGSKYRYDFIRSVFSVEENSL